MRGLFVTGTDTGIGKTVSCAALMHRYRGHVPLRYWKPIQTGIEQDDDTAEVRRLGDCQLREIFSRGIRLPLPLSPHLSAKRSGQVINIRSVASSISPAEANGSAWIVEGAGGAFVPINDNELMIDLMALLGLPVLIVARTTLGTINHTLLTIGALRARQLTIAGVMMIGERNSDNRAAIESYGTVRVHCQMPMFPQLTPEALGRWAKTELDPYGQLLEFLQ